MHPVSHSQPSRLRSFLAGGGWVLLALPAWVLAYLLLKPASEAMTFQAFGLARGSRLGEAIAFFLYDAPKVLLLLVLVVFCVSFLQTYIQPEAVRARLSHRKGLLGNLLAALFGIITPFCSCSAVPLFIGFLRAGVPLGVTFSFLVSAPMVNEVALGMLLGMFGWRIALLYAATGTAIAFLAGWVLGLLRQEAQLEAWVQDALEGAAPDPGAPLAAVRPPLRGRFALALEGVRDVVGKVWPYVLAGIAAGALIHGYVPMAFMARMLGGHSWWSVPLAVLVGIPLYSNAAGVMPIVEALLGKGAALGSTLAFMMAVIGLSLPEMLILRKVLKPRLIATFVGVVAAGILLTGYLFNALL